MKTLEELTVSARKAASRDGMRIIGPMGVYKRGLFFYASLADGEGGAVGLPLAYWVDLDTGEARLCTTEESDLLTERWFLASLGPVPD